ncbi:MAG TPA: hypothetical protein VFC78_08020 [Tepidisphaeraceae bacterium]|nr:hypothetical protein [Tepidisphaeraceae bacterium]
MRHNHLPAICEALERRLQLSGSLDFVNPDGSVLPSGSTIDFGTVQTSQSVDKIIQVRNDGNATVTVNLVLGQNSLFQIYTDSPAVLAPTSGRVLVPGAIGQVLVPGAIDTFSVTLDVATSGDAAFLGPTSVFAIIVNTDNSFSSNSPQPSLALKANIVPDPPRIAKTISFNSRQQALFTDAGGNTVRVRLDGPGSGTLGFATTGNADIKDLTLSNTTAASSLSITPLGKSHTHITGNVSISGSIGQFIAPNVDFITPVQNVPAYLAGGSFSVGGAIRTLSIGNIAGLDTTPGIGNEAGLETISIGGQLPGTGVGHGAAKVLPLQLTAGSIADTTLLDTQPIESIHVASWIDTHPMPQTDIGEQIQAPSIAQLSSRGDFTVGLFTKQIGSVRNATIGGTVGDPWIIAGRVGQLSLGAVPAYFGGTVSGKVESLVIRHDDAGTIAAGRFGQILIGGNMTGAKILAGANLGTDGLIGGANTIPASVLPGVEDTYSAGSISSLQVDGAGTNVFVSAGFQPTDGWFDNPAGTVIGGGASAIRRISFRKGIDAASAFVAGAFGTVRIPQALNPKSDGHFHL